VVARLLCIGFLIVALCPSATAALHIWVTFIDLGGSVTLMDRFHGYGARCMPSLLAVMLLGLMICSTSTTKRQLECYVALQVY